MFAALSVAWLILFVVNLIGYQPTTSWWLRAVFSAVLLVASVGIAITLYRRRAR